MNQAEFAYQECRRAIRLAWKRPVCIVEPTRCNAHTVNVSATGILIEAGLMQDYQVGSEIAIMIPNMDGIRQMVVNGQVVRVERKPQRSRIAVNLVN